MDLDSYSIHKMIKGPKTSSIKNVTKSQIDNSQIKKYIYKKPIESAKQKSMIAGVPKPSVNINTTKNVFSKNSGFESIFKTKSGKNLEKTFKS